MSVYRRKNKAVHFIGKRYNAWVRRSEIIDGYECNVSYGQIQLWQDCSADSVRQTLRNLTAELKVKLERAYKCSIKEST